MRWPALLLLMAVGPTQLGCGDSCGDVNCGDPETLYVGLPDAAPAASSVEVCFQDACGVAYMASRTQRSVPWAELGDWSDHKDDLVQVSVRTSNGETLSTGSAVADNAGGCCGDYWTVRPE
jgi:hypothetical protein